MRATFPFVVSTSGRPPRDRYRDHTDGGLPPTRFIRRGLATPRHAFAASPAVRLKPGVITPASTVKSYARNGAGTTTPGAGRCNSALRPNPEYVFDARLSNAGSTVEHVPNLSLGDIETGPARKCAGVPGSRVESGRQHEVDVVVSTAQGLRETVEPVPHT